MTLSPYRNHRYSGCYDCLCRIQPQQVQRLKEFGIKFRRNKPASLHLNGKVERSQKTDKTEFYSTVDLNDESLSDLLAEWQDYYNWDRPHSAHNGKIPMERYFELSDEAPLWEDVSKDYHPEAERIQNPNYKVDLELRKLKRSL